MLKIFLILYFEDFDISRYKYKILLIKKVKITDFKKKTVLYYQKSLQKTKGM